MKLRDLLFFCCLVLGPCVSAQVQPSSVSTVYDPGFEPHITVPREFVGPEPSNYQKSITAALARRGAYQSSDELEFRAPHPAVVQDSQHGKLTNHYGWVVKVLHTPNPKPSLYIGPRHYYFMFADGQLADITTALVQGFGAYVSTDPPHR